MVDNRPIDGLLVLHNTLEPLFDFRFGNLYANRSAVRTAQTEIAFDFCHKRVYLAAIQCVAAFDGVFASGLHEFFFQRKRNFLGLEIVIVKKIVEKLLDVYRA